MVHCSGLLNFQGVGGSVGVGVGVGVCVVLNKMRREELGVVGQEG